MKRSKAFTLIELLVVIAIIALLISILLPSLSRARELSKRTVCAANERGIGQSFYIYAQDDPGVFPAYAQVYTPNNGAMKNYSAQNEPSRNLPSSTTGIPSVTQDMWLVVRANNTTPKQFNCPSTTDVPDPAQDTTAYYDFLTDTQNSGKSQYQSYAYQYQHDPNRRIIGTSSEPTFPVLADANPYIKGEVTGNNTGAVTTDRKSANRGNSKNHSNREGQNVLFQDGHVSFEKGPDVGLSGRVLAAVQQVSKGRDNIYTVHGAAALAEVDPGSGPASPNSLGGTGLGTSSDACLVP